MTYLSTPIAYFKKEAKKLFRLVKVKDSEALARVLRVLADQNDITLMRVQHVVAVEHGFSKWEDLAKTPEADLQLAIEAKKRLSYKSNESSIKPPGTPLGNFLRGTGILPPSPKYEALADMFDKMTMEEQERYLDDDARTMGVFNHK